MKSKCRKQFYTLKCLELHMEMLVVKLVKVKIKTECQKQRSINGFSSLVSLLRWVSIPQLLRGKRGHLSIADLAIIAL